MRITSLMLLLITAMPLQAETLYVTDFIRFSLREAPTKNSKLIVGVPSGAAVSVLDTLHEEGYSKVETEDGKIGYIETRRLQKEPSAKRRLNEAEKKLAELMASPDKITARLTTASKNFDQLKADHERQMNKNEKLRKELEAIRRTSANAVRISDERNELRKQLADLAREKAEIEQKYTEVSNQREQRWFMIGAGVLFGGILLGIILPNLRVRKQKSYLSSF